RSTRNSNLEVFQLNATSVTARAGASVSRRKTCVFVALAVMTAVVAPLVSAPGESSGAVDWTLSPDIPRKPSSVKLSGLDRGTAYDLWADVLVMNYGVSTRFVKALYDRRYDYGDVALLMEVSRAAKREPENVAPLKRQGLGWGAIAKRLGIRPASLERAKGNDSLFRRYTLSRCLANYYKMPDDRSIVILNEKGYGFEEIVLAANVCAHTGSPLRSVVSARQTGMRWRFVAEKHKMSPAKLGTPPAKSAAGKSSPTAQPKSGKTSRDTKSQSK
ncbi:MAG: hypothetical protein JW952_02925, partial [Candidatus Eisenbacteria bacterium]|nr:hypothetical protein [Candidatus Eisenbacteria bacterium]